MKTALAILVGTTVVVLLLTFAAPRPDRTETAGADLPWRIDVAPDGSSRVFGLTLGRSTLDDASSRLGPAPQVAIVTAPGEPGALEAYFESVALGFLTANSDNVAVTSNVTRRVDFTLTPGSIDVGTLTLTVSPSTATATVSVRSGTSLVVPSQTGQGAITIPNIPVGVYTVGITASGFTAASQTNVTIRLNLTTDLGTVTLKVQRT